MQTRRFPWARLFLLWAVLSFCIVALFWRTAIALDFNDPDDFLRMQQVRDLLAGQSWFDLTQHRIAPPTGLAMHWSRLVDIPILLFLAPLRLLIGQHLAEVIAIIGAPLLTMLALMVAMVTIARRLIGYDHATAALACVLALSAPAVFLQIHPARIDHHGWQIVFAAAATAALMQQRARSSGICAGLALALYLNISIEGMPFVAAAVGVTGLLWATGRDDGARLAAMLWTMAVATLLSSALMAPASRWTEGLCDAVSPAHIGAMAVAAMGTSLAVRLGNARGTLFRFLMLGSVLVVSIAALALAAPRCLGSPFGRMDPVVDGFWYHNVVEGMPLWRQDALGAASVIGFPLVGLVGAIIALRRASSSERRRRWLIMIALLVVALVTGALVRRASGIAHVVAVPGALVLIGLIVGYAHTRFGVVARAAASALALIGFSPVMPVLAVAAVIPAEKAGLARPDRTVAGDRNCALRHLANQLPQTIMTGIDLGPSIIATTPHRVYAAGYHRLESPLRNTIALFAGSSEQGRAFMQAERLHLILIAPQSEEARLFAKKAPDGLMAQLIRGQVPSWLIEQDLGSPGLRLYRVRMTP
jgi:hypothetical protein